MEGLCVSSYARTISIAHMGDDVELCRIGPVGFYLDVSKFSYIAVEHG